MTLWQAILLGALQGATEFLPVSSDGHLVLAEHLLGLKAEGAEFLVFNLLLHVATAIAIIVAYREDLTNLLLAAIGKRTFVKSPKFGLEMRDIWYTPEQARGIIGRVALATVVTGGLYLAMKDWIDPVLESLWMAGIGFLITSGALTIAMRAKTGEMNIRGYSWWHAAAIGAAQFPPILPGVSRSGCTIAAGLLLGSHPVDAAKFSFLMAIPAILGGFVLELMDNPEAFASIGDPFTLAMGFLTAMGVGIWAIGLLVKMLKQRSLWPFVFYTAVLGVITLLLAAFGS